MNKPAFGFPVRAEWVSPPLTIATQGFHQFAHGMGTDRLTADWLLQCVTAEAGYEPGDIIPAAQPASGEDAGARPAAIALRGGQVLIRFANRTSPFLVVALDTGGNAALTNARWIAFLRLRS